MEARAAGDLGGLVAVLDEVPGGPPVPRDVCRPLVGPHAPLSVPSLNLALEEEGAELLCCASVRNDQVEGNAASCCFAHLSTSSARAVRSQPVRSPLAGGRMLAQPTHWSIL